MGLGTTIRIDKGDARSSDYSSCFVLVSITTMTAGNLVSVVILVRILLVTRLVFSYFCCYLSGHQSSCWISLSFCHHHYIPWQYYYLSRSFFYCCCFSLDIPMFGCRFCVGQKSVPGLRIREARPLLIG